MCVCAFAGCVPLSVPGEMPPRPLPDKLVSGWRELARIFRTLLGGAESCVQAANYLEALANNQLPTHDLLPLRWLEGQAPVEVLPGERAEMHPCVLAVLSPSVPLRAVWRRGR